MDIFLNHLIQFYSNNATNLRHNFTQYTVLPRNIKIVVWPQITVTSLRPIYNTTSTLTRSDVYCLTLKTRRIGSSGLHCVIKLKPFPSDTVIRFLYRGLSASRRTAFTDTSRTGSSLLIDSFLFVIFLFWFSAVYVKLRCHRCPSSSDGWIRYTSVVPSTSDYYLDL